MIEKAPKIFTYMAIALAVLVGLLVIFVNKNLAGLAEWIYPGAEPWAHLALAVVEIIAALWFWNGLFGGAQHLLRLDAESPEEEAAFSQELARRMKKNPHIQKAQIQRQDGESEAEYLERCLVFLKGKADEEIAQNARRIFLATALTQNGRLDALIVFVSLCRLVWRVSKIYNQRPHPKEISALYWTVASSTFLALSIEELDIPTEITVGFGEAFHAMLPAGVTASVPFAGKVLQTFTAATIDGTANCYLALRAGIITRNAYMYGMHKEQRPSRAAVFREAGKVLYGMSGDLVDRIGKAVGGSLAGAAKSAGTKTLQTGADIVDGIGSSAGKLAAGTVSAVQGTGRGIASAGEKTVHIVQDTVQGAGKGIAFVGNKTVDVVQGTAQSIQNVGRGAVKLGVGAVDLGAGTVKGVGKAVEKSAGAVWKAIANPFRSKKKKKR